MTSSASTVSQSVRIGVMWGVESRLTAADDVMLDILGYTREELDNGAIDWRALTPPEFLHLDDAGIQQAMQSGGFTVPYQKEFFRKDGSRIPVLLVCAFVPDTPGAWTGYVIDLSRRLAADPSPAQGPINPIDPVPEEFYRRLVGELVTERTRLHAMLDASVAPIWSVDEHFRLLASNEAFQAIQQRVSGRIMNVGQSLISDEFPEADRLAWQQHYTRALQGESFLVHTQQRTAFGSSHLDHYLSPIRDADGKIFGVTVVAHDVTKRRAAEEAERASDARFRSLAASAPLGVFQLNAAGECVYANGRLCEILQLSEQSLQSDGLLLHVHPDDRVRVTKAWTDAVEQGAPLQIEYRVVLSGGTEHVLRVWWSVLLQDDSAAGFVGCMEDATQRQAVESRNQQRERMESLGTLAGGIAHDFNNMLGVVLGYAELALSEPGLPAVVTEELQEIQNAGMRARDLVRQILTFSRRSENEHEDFDLVALTRETARMLRATLPSSVSLDVLTPDHGISVFGNPSSLQQVIVNLCVNAEHAMRGTEVPRIEIEMNETSAPRGCVQLRVRDNGRGMPREVAERIFEPFFTTKAAGEGTGMGLSVAHGTVAAHGGTIEAQSVVGSGTTFVVTLPIAGPRDSAKPASPTAH